MKRMEYFGTSMTEYGHYRWNLSADRMECMWLKFNDLPFDPEQLTRNMKRGDLAFYCGGGFTAIAISGSVKDSRPGTKSVFWINETMSMDDLIHEIEKNPIASALIKNMPFDIPILNNKIIFE